MTLTRRQLLLGGVGLSAVALGAYTAWRAEPNELAFDFLQRGGDESLKEWANSEQNLIEKSIPVTGFSRGFIDAQSREWAIYYANEKGVRETQKSHGNVQLFRVNDRIESRHRVIPEPNLKYADQYKTYCEFATEFLYGHIALESLPKIPISWIFPHVSQPNSAVPAYVGHSYINEQKITLEFKLEEDRTVHGEIVYPKPESGGTMLGATWDFDQQTGELKKGTWYPLIIVSTHNTLSLQAPFSEVTPLMFIEGIRTYTRQLAKNNQLPDSTQRRKMILEDSAQLMETITESLSLYLTTKIITHPSMRKVGVSVAKIEKDGLQIARAPKYSDVPKAYEYLKKKGIQHAVRLFTENPSIYLQEIRAV